MPQLLYDARQALRYLRKSLSFTLAAGLIFALGIGVNTTIFSLTYAIVLKALPVANPGRLVRYTFARGDLDIGLSGPLYDALRKYQSVCTDILAWSVADFTWENNGAQQTVRGAMMSGNGFAVLGLQPATGRAFGTGDDVPHGGEAGYQALLAYDFWKSDFGGDPSILGRTLRLNGEPVHIIGVLPRGFEGLVVGQRADIVLPLAFAPVLHPGATSFRDNPGSFWLTVMGRLRAGQSVNSARANLFAIRATIYQQADPAGSYLHGFFKSFVPSVESGAGGRSALRNLYGRPLLLIELLCGFLLVLCSANFGLLVLARLSARRVEFAVRSALGASRLRLIGQTFLEIALIAIPGMLAGVYGGSLLAAYLASMLGQIGDPAAVDVSPRLPVLLCSAGVAVFTAILGGLWPILATSGAAPAIDLRQSRYSSPRSGSGAWTIAVQVAASIMLLVPALLLGSTFARLYSEPSGFRGQGLAFADIDLRPSKLSPDQAASASVSLLAAVQRGPGVRSAAIFSTPPLRGWMSSTHIFSYDRHATEHSDPEVWPEAVTPDYFEAVGSLILTGRGFTSADAGERVCVLSRSAAEFFFPGEEAVGRLVYNAMANSTDVDAATAQNARRVVGVAEDAHFFSLRKQPDHVIYTPADKDLYAGGLFEIAVRSSDAAAAAERVRNSLRAAAPGAAPPIIYTYGQLLIDQLRRERMLVAVSISFGAIALILVAVGLFGLLTRSVAQRTREIGIRIALGGPRSSIVRSVVDSAMRPRRRRRLPRHCPRLRRLAALIQPAL